MKFKISRNYETEVRSGYSLDLITLELSKKNTPYTIHNMNIVYIQKNCRYAVKKYKPKREEIRTYPWNNITATLSRT